MPLLGSFGPTGALFDPQSGQEKADQRMAGEIQHQNLIDAYKRQQLNGHLERAARQGPDMQSDYAIQNASPQDMDLLAAYGAFSLGG